MLSAKADRSSERKRTRLTTGVTHSVPVTIRCVLTSCPPSVGTRHPLSTRPSDPMRRPSGGAHPDRRARAKGCEAHAITSPGQPFSPVELTPSMICFCPMKKMMIIGIVAMTLAVTMISQCHSPPKPKASTSDFSPRGIVKVDESRR